jgi:YggT family protein
VDILRYAVFGLFTLVALIAVGSWAVTTYRVHRFGHVARLVRTVSDPLLVPIEHWLLSRGGNPQNAPWWLLGIAIAAGILVITAAEVVADLVGGLLVSVRSGPRGILRFVVSGAAQLVSVALIIRVIGSWFGVGRFNRWMRPAYRLTDWLVEPLRRLLPTTFGPVDFSPLLAWLLLQFILIPVLLAVL